MSIHPTARGFEVAAEVYERARPEYPDEALDWIVDELALEAGSSVVDLGAGTGKLTRLLVARGLRVTAVEPVREMREVLARVVSRADAVDGTAEAIPLAARSADAVTAAQSFHWFDTERALPEIHRVLRPGGGVALLWNVRDEDDPLQSAYADVLRPYRGEDYPLYHGPEPFAATPLFEPAQKRVFRHAQLLDAEGLVERAASVSFVARLPEEERAALLERIRELAPAGTFAFPYLTKVFTCRRR